MPDTKSLNISCKPSPSPTIRAAELARKIVIFNKGRTKVDASGHTLILGWDESYIREIIKELGMAKESEYRPRIVILSHLDKIYMDDYISYYFRPTGRVKILTRSGDITSIKDLDMVKADASKSIIIIPRVDELDKNTDFPRSDNIVVKTVIALSNIVSDKHDLNIVTEIFDRAKYEALQKFVDIKINLIQTKEIITKIVAQLSQSKGVSEVYDLLLTFSGKEVYPVKNLNRYRCFSEAIGGIGGGLAVGLINTHGNVLISPEDSCELSGDDQILVLSEDDSKITCHVNIPLNAGSPLAVRPSSATRQRQKILVIGWSPYYLGLIDCLLGYLLPQSKLVFLFSENHGYERYIAEFINKFTNLDIEINDGDCLDYEVISSQVKNNYDSIIILPDNKYSQDPQADTKTIVVMMMIKDLVNEGISGSATNIIVEITDSSNCDLVDRIGVTNFIVSKKILGSLYAQLSESPELLLFYDALFDSSGAEIYLKSAGSYLQALPSGEVQFKDLVLSSREVGDLCIGVKSSGGILLAPPMDSRLALQADDELILLSNSLPA